MADESLIINAIVWALDSITILTFLGFLYRFCKIRHKNSGLYMILILTIADLLLSLFNIAKLLILQEPSMSNFSASTEIFLFRFSLFWSTAISIFICVVYKQSWHYSAKTFMIIALIVCLLLSALFPLLIYLNIWHIWISYVSRGVYAFHIGSTGYEKSMYVIFYDGITGLLPILITLYCYYQVYTVQKQIEGFDRNVMKASPLFWYSIIEIICFVPQIVMDIICTYQQIDYPFIAAIIITLAYRSWGFLNIIVYWRLMPSNDETLAIQASPKLKFEMTLSASFSDQELSI